MRRLKARAPALPAIAVCLLVFLILLEIFRFTQPSSSSTNPNVSDPQAGRFFSDLDYIQRDIERDNIPLEEWKKTHNKMYHGQPWRLQAEFLHERIRTAGLPLVDFSPDDPRGDVPVPLCQAQDRDFPPSYNYKVGSFQRKVYDVVTFLDELDTLEIRLQTLYPVVDKFILVMCEKSFMNNTVELINVKTLPRFARFKDKIQNVYCDLATWPMHDPSPWNREDHMRNVTMDAVSGIDDEDVAMMGDLDELPKPWVVNALRTNTSQEFPVVLQMPLYRFSFGCIDPKFEAEDQWPATVVTLGKYIRGGHPKPYTRELHSSGQNVRRKLRNECDIVIKCGGWHCSSCLSIPTYINKITQYSHGGEIPNDFKDPRLVQDQIETCLFGTMTRTRSLVGLPQVLFDEKERFGYLLPV